MVLHLAVESAVPSSFAGDKGTVNIIQVVLTDKTKPAMFRSQTRFVLNMMPDSYRKLWGDTLEIEEERLTVLAKGMEGKGAIIKLKGEVLKGWATTEQVEALARTLSVIPGANPEPVTGSPVSAGQASAPAAPAQTKKAA